MRFVRYDPNTGEILAVGEMQEDHIDMLISQGDHLIKTEENIPLTGYKVDPATKTIQLIQSVAFSPPIQQIKALIQSELQRTDYTQAADALDHMSQEEIDAWRNYRNSIRTAYNANTYEEMISALPATIPSGEYPFSMYKQIG